MSKVHYECLQGVSYKVEKWENTDVCIICAKRAFNALIRVGSDLILTAKCPSFAQLWAKFDFELKLILLLSQRVANATQLLHSCELSVLIWQLLTCDFLIKYKLRRHLEAEKMSISVSKWSVKQRSVLDAVHISAREKNKMLCLGSYKEWSGIFRENSQNETPQTSIATINARYQDKVLQYLLLNWVIHPFCALLIRALGDPGKWTISGLKESGK